MCLANPAIRAATAPPPMWNVAVHLLSLNSTARTYSSLYYHGTPVDTRDLPDVGTAATAFSWCLNHGVITRAAEKAKKGLSSLI